ncbi:Elf4 domain-containing protein, partial [Mycobacterium kansasii]
MDDGARRKTAAGDGRRRRGSDTGDAAAWSAFSESFSEVQAVIDRNRELIQQANENHQSRMPDNM